MKQPILIALFAVAILAVACATPTQPSSPAGDTTTGAPGSVGEEPIGTPNQQDVSPEQNTSGTGGDDGAATGGGGVVTGPLPTQQVSLTAYNWGWTPSTVTVKKDVPVTITVTSQEGTHGLAIPALGVNSGTFGEGETKTVTFTPDKAGEFPFFCNVFCGEGHRGMHGTLVVTS